MQIKKPREKKRKRKFGKDDMQLSLLALPTFIWYILFAFLPMFGIIIAFKKFTFRPGHNFISNLLASPWNGFKNFEFFFKSNSAWLITRNTIGYNFVFIILGVLIPVTLAIMLSQMNGKKFGKASQTAIFLPYFMSWVVVTYIVGAFLNYDLGMFNRMIASNGGKKVQWYMEQKYWPYILIFLNTWKSMGYGMVVYMATITGIDSSLYEAARIDGAGRWQQVRYITVPLLKTTMIMLFILSVGRIFYSDFGLFYQVPRGSASLQNVTETMDVFVYRALSGSVDISLPSAAGFVQSVAGCVTILLSNFVVKRFDKESALI